MLSLIDHTTFLSPACQLQGTVSFIITTLKPSPARCGTRLYAQAKVLRVLQEKEFERLGSSESVKTDVRIISATNKDLLEQMEKRLFREDLYYRLNVVTIHLPPLRERGDDLKLLTQFFLKK